MTPCEAVDIPVRGQVPPLASSALKRGAAVVDEDFQDGSPLPERARAMILRAVDDPQLRPRMLDALNRARLKRVRPEEAREVAKQQGLRGVAAYATGTTIHVPAGSHLTLHTLAHEVFHVYQYLYDPAYRAGSGRARHVDEGIRLLVEMTAKKKSPAERERKRRRMMYENNPMERDARDFADMVYRRNIGR